MTIEQMRDYIAKYPKYKQSPKWISKVSKMPDAQIIAVYNRLLATK